MISGDFSATLHFVALRSKRRSGIVMASGAEASTLQTVPLNAVAKLATNGSGLCDGAAIEAKIFNFAQKLNRRTTVELCSLAPLSQTRCYAQCFCHYKVSQSLYSNHCSLLFFTFFIIRLGGSLHRFVFGS